MLPGFPVEVDGNCDFNIAVVFYKKLSLLTDAVLEARPEPRVGITWNVYSRCSDEIIP